MSSNTVSPSNLKLTWEEMFAVLKSYREEHGNINMHKTGFVHNPKLGNWVYNQRLYYKHYKAGNKDKRACRGMCPQRVRLMEGIGFQWRLPDDETETASVYTPSPATTSKKTRSAAVHTPSPASSSKKYPKAGSKASGSENDNYLNASASPIARNAARSLKLALKSTSSSSTEKKTKREKSPVSADKDRGSLAKSKTAIINQRKKEIDDSSTDDNTETASGDGGSENRVVQSEEWESKLGDLIKFKDIHGHVDVPRRYRPNPKLGKWVDYQRTGCRKFIAGEAKGRNGMNKDRLERLSALGFNFSMKGKRPQKLNQEFLSSSTRKRKMTTTTTPNNHNPSKESVKDKGLGKPQISKKPYSSTIGDSFRVENSTASNKLKNVDTGRGSDIPCTSSESQSIAEIILRKYGLHQGEGRIDYTSFKSLGHYYYLKSHALLDQE